MLHRSEPVPFPWDVAIISSIFVALSTIIYASLRLELGLTLELVALTDLAIVILGIAVPALLGVGWAPWHFFYLVIAFCFTEEILVNSALYPYGIALAFVGLVGFPAMGALTAGKNDFLRIALEISGIIFITRIALIPFPAKVLDLALGPPAVYTLIMSVIVIYLIFRRIPLSRIAFTRGIMKIPLQVAFAALGLPLGVIEYEILRPAPLNIGPSPLLNEVYLALVMILFVGVTEEVLFRGLLLNYLNNLMPQWLGVHISSLIFALFSIGYLDPIEVLFAYSAGVIFAYLVIKTGGLTSSILAHGVSGIVLFTLASVLAH